MTNETTDLVAADGTLSAQLQLANLGESESFGGLTLAENAKRVDSAIEKMSGLDKIWNRSKTEWLWKHVNFSNYDDIGNIKQVSAELTAKVDALRSAKWRYLKNTVELDAKKEELAEKKLNKPYSKDTKLLEIEIMEMEEGMLNSLRYVEGAMKDVLTLEDIYNQLMDRVKSLSEEEVEANQVRHHIMKSISQALRDVRADGRITRGNQEYLEFLGINPTKIQIDLQKFVEAEAARDDYDGTWIADYVRKCADELHHLSDKKAVSMGFRPDTEFNKSIVWSSAAVSIEDKSGE